MLPRTMQRRLPYRSPKKRKAFIYSYQRFYARCFRKIQHIDGMEIALREKTLDPLDLAAGYSHSSKMWEKSLKLQIIRCLPPFCAEYLTPETKLPPYSMLGTVLERMSKMLVESHESYQHQRQTFVDNMYGVIEGYILGLREFQCVQKRKLVRNYLKLADILNIFRDESNEARFTKMYKALLKLLMNDLPGNGWLVVEMLNTICVDDDFRLSVFLDVTDQVTLEFLLCRAQEVRFDFWGLWRGVGHLSARFNPVAVLFNYGRSELATTLLNYGFQYANVGTVYDDRCYLLSSYRYRDMPIIKMENILLLIQKRPKDRMLLILDIFLIFSDFNGPSDNSDKISNLVQISRSLPHPYVSTRELFYALASYLELTFYHKLIRICQKYGGAEVYDDDCRFSNPRRLVHLSRCAVRNVLAAQFRLPHGIDALGLKEPLRAYLHLER